MATYIMSIKSRNAGDNILNSTIWRTEASELSEAKQYFVELKQLKEEDFDRMFIVTEIRKGGNNENR